MNGKEAGLDQKKTIRKKQRQVDAVCAFANYGSVFAEFKRKQFQISLL